MKKLHRVKASLPPMSQRWKEPYADGPKRASIMVNGDREVWEETGLACPFCQEVSFTYSEVYENGKDYLGKQLLCIACGSKFSLPAIHFHTMLFDDDKERIKQLDKFSIQRDRE